MNIAPTFIAMIGTTLAGQLAILAYDVAVTRAFGTSADADALAFAFMVTFALGNEVAGWISALAVPKYLEGEQAEAGVGGRLLSAMLVALTLLTALMAAALIALAPLTATFLPERPATPGRLVRLFSPLVVLLPLTALLASALHANRRFGLVATRSLIWYGAAVLGILLYGHHGAGVIAIAMTCGLAAYAAALGTAAGRVLQRPRRETWRHLRSLARFAAPLVVMSVVNYSQILVERRLAGGLGEGALSGLTYAFRLVNAPISLFVVTAASMLFPLISTHSLRAGRTAAAAMVFRAVGVSLMFTVPLAALIMSCADVIVPLLFQRGAFDAASSRITALALFYYAPALVGLTALQLLVRGYWALGNISRLAVIELAVGVAGVALMVIFTATLDLRGLAIAVSLTAVLHAAVLLVGLPGALAGSAVRSLRRLAVTIGATTLVAVAIALSARLAAANPFVQLGVGFTAGAVTYALLIRRVAPVEWVAALSTPAQIQSHPAPGRSSP